MDSGASTRGDGARGAPLAFEERPVRYSRLAVIPRYFLQMKDHSGRFCDFRF
jgi:hypothetical protein